MKILKYYDDAFEAHTDREYLESEGITAVVLNENTSLIMPYTLGIASLRVHIVVSDEDYPKAAALLKVDLVQDKDEKACPECGSTDVRYGFRGKNRFQIAVIYMLLPLTIICNFPLGQIGMRFYCGDCRREFK